jgi:imidazolonepropionase-like amidohydrolase
LLIVEFAFLGLLVGCAAQPEARSSTEVESEDVPALYLSGVVVLSGVDVIDGTGGPVKKNQVVVLRGNRIDAVADAGTIELPAHAQVRELTGHTLIPGIVGMHNHTHMPGIPFLGEAAARLNLASGVTTIQTAGSASPDAELQLAAAIERGEIPGPNVFASSQYVTGTSGSSAMEQPATPEEARASVRRWASLGVDWIKIYRHIQPDIAQAVIDEAHGQGLRVTGHLCSLTFREAAAMGIDRIEHGLIAASDFDDQKVVGECPGGSVARIEALDPGGAEVQKLIRFLVEQDVTLTSTLAIIESHFPHRPQGEERALRFLSTAQLADYEERQLRLKKDASQAVYTESVFRKMLLFERDFVRAGGRLVAGPDTGRHVLPGLGDQRNYELLQEAGFSLVETIQIMTRNGAIALGISEKVGSIEPGMRADLVVLRSDPTTLRQIVTVYKHGKAHVPSELLAGLEGQVGASGPVR